MDQSPLPANGNSQWFTSDAQFNTIFPASIREKTRRHWTPLLVAQKAAAFLRTAPGTKILDIGSGCGKFCLAAGYFYPDTLFAGVEQRAYLTEEANKALHKLQLKNVAFLTANITRISFRDYQHFYFYNSFHENIASSEKIDDLLPLSKEIFDEYNFYLFKQLRNTRKGTRLVTYHSVETTLPDEFQIVQTDVNDYLHCFIKI
jgi:cyclopropane fatty-acyl-phospholipid synthase-like methyltransferase